MVFIALVPVIHYTHNAFSIALNTTRKAPCPNPAHKLKSSGIEYKLTVKIHFVGHRKERKKKKHIEHISVFIGASGNLLPLHIIIEETKPRLPVEYTRKGDFPCASLCCKL